jgi:hypothetical protein
LIPRVGDAVALVETVLEVTIMDDRRLDEVEIEVDGKTTDEVEVELEIDSTTLDELGLIVELEVDCTTLLLLLLLESRDVSSYISSLFPAPQYSYLIITVSIAS